MGGLAVERERAIGLLRFARGIITQMGKEFPEDKATFQPSAFDNHYLWNLGHLALTLQWLTNMLDGSKGPLPEKYNELFGGKSKPTADAKAYPALSEVKKFFDSELERFIGAVNKLPESELGQSLEKETGGFAKDKLDLVYKAAWHEGWHTGQIGTLRRALGLKPVM